MNLSLVHKNKSMSVASNRHIPNVKIYIWFFCYNFISFLSISSPLPSSLPPQWSSITTPPQPSSSLNHSPSLSHTLRNHIKNHERLNLSRSSNALQYSCSKISFCTIMMECFHLQNRKIARKFGWMHSQCKDALDPFEYDILDWWRIGCCLEWRSWIATKVHWKG